MMIKKIAYFFVLITVISSCKKKDEFEEISKTPQIEFVSISPSAAKEYQDKIAIVISYKDGDGDLGENGADIKNLFVKDLRNGVSYQYRIPQLAPSGAAIAIQGNLPIVLNNTAITNGAASQSVSYSIYVKDRAGNISNSVSTTPITVVQ